MTMVKVSAFAPDVRFVELAVPTDVRFTRRGAVERIDDAERRFVDHCLREGAIEKIKLRIVMMPREVPTIRAVERAMAHNEFHVRITRAVVPDRRGRFHFVDRTVRDVTPAAWTNEID